ncbi:endonuclease/exonuclease/phosphatase family protein [Micromonosporaceae bacterium Da 78-11]
MGLSLASVNLHCGLDRRGRPFSVKQAITTIGADVIVVQENWCPQGADSLARRAAADCGYRGYTEVALTGDVPLADLEIVRGQVPDETGSWGLAVLSRLPLHDRPAVDLGAAPGDVVGTRSAQVVAVEVDGGVLRLVNVHLTHRLAHGPRQLRRLVAGLGGDTRPTVIAGDLNMFRPTVSLARPFRPVVRGRTWPAHRPIVQIDHLLAGRGVTVAETEVLAEVGTDHRPVRARLGLS